ncbi:hypothetical protein [Flexivirga meconopsidis]|uniref:hypothetical protein n=1 Tax=Flexivirga meconopsidis TaxID=2977121 RepID=UPI002240D2C4|nr:hypothetical protein [Flexivirga meconopsidis]
MTRFVLAASTGYAFDATGDSPQAWLTNLDTGPIMVLPPQAAVILRCALETVGDELTSRVAAASGLPLAEIASASEEFVRQLVREGYLLDRSATATRTA